MERKEQEVQDKEALQEEATRIDQMSNTPAPAFATTHEIWSGRGKARTATVETTLATTPAKVKS